MCCAYRVRLLILLIFFVIPDVVVASNIVGLLKSKTQLYDNENKFSITSEEFIESFGGEVIRIDYNDLVAQPGDLGSNVRDFLVSSKIHKVFIPGDFYNFDSLPHHPNDHRIRVTGVLLDLAKEKKITIVAICGGLQAAMHLQGVKVKHLDDSLIPTHRKDFDLYSDSLYENPEAVMNSIKLDPTSKIVSLMHPPQQLYDENGWINLSIPDTHSEAVLRTEENLKVLKSLGYRVVGVSDVDSVIEIIEDNYGNWFFQGHPDGLMLLHTTHSKYSALPDDIKFSIDALKRFWRSFILS